MRQLSRTPAAGGFSCSSCAASCRGVLEPARGARRKDSCANPARGLGRGTTTSRNRPPSVTPIASGLGNWLHLLFERFVRFPDRNVAIKDAAEDRLRHGPGGQDLAGGRVHGGAGVSAGGRVDGGAGRWRRRACRRWRGTVAPAGVSTVARAIAPVVGARNVDGLNGGHLERARTEPSMHTTTMDAVSRDCAASGMPHMHGTSWRPRVGPIVASCMVRPAPPSGTRRQASLCPLPGVRRYPDRPELSAGTRAAAPPIRRTRGDRPRAARVPQTPR